MNNKTNEQIKAQIKYMRDIENLSFRQIGESLGMSRVRCSRLYCGKVKNTQQEKKNLNILEQRYQNVISEWYRECPSLKASQVYERLKARQIDISYQSVTKFTRSFRLKPSKCYFPMTFDPGEEAQVDWFIVSHPVLGTLAGFALILSYSRFLFARIFPKMSFEFFIEGHLTAFDVLRGITRACRYDNLKSVVLKRHPRTYNAAFLEFTHHYGFEIRLCNVRAGNEKGRVERAIRTIRETFLNTADHHQSLRALNSALSQWLIDKNSTVHRTTGKPPIVLKGLENLKPLPTHTWLNRVVHPPKLPTKTGLILFDTNQYSVPEYLVGQNLSVHAFCDRIEIYGAKGKNPVATHPRSFERSKMFLNPLHRSFTRIASKTKTERIYTVIKNLDPSVEQFLNLNEHCGENPLHTAHTIFQLIHSHPRRMVLSAIGEALMKNTPRINYVCSLLMLHGSATTHQEDVHPQNKNLLTINYTPRSLEEYNS